MAELVTIYAKNKEIDLAAVSETDKAVHEYIFSEKDRNQDEGRFPVYLALSELRRGLFSWYDFGREASILEIGGGYGALTGLFCERAREVVVTERSPYRAQIIQKRYEDRDNLSVYVGDILEMTFEKKFDYIILTGILERAGKGSFDREPYVSYLQSLQQFLKPGGILLAAVDNRYGLRYFAGMKNIHTGKVFDSIRKYPEGNRGAHSFTRKEIDEIWEQAGFDAKKVYYPLPDYRLPQLIYTDAYLPENNLRERLIPYYPDHVSMLFNENLLYDDLVANDVFPFFANSFLVEAVYDAATGKGLGKVLYAAVSTDRGKERSFATVIYEDDSVAKIPLYMEGTQNMQQLCAHVQDLAARGLDVVPQTIESGRITMPRMHLPMLSNYIKEDIFAVGDKIDASAVSKGKGFQGAIKRHGQHRGPMAHGSKFHRHQGSNGACSSPSRVFKGKGMPGHMGCVKVTVQNLEIVRVDAEKNLLLVKGSVPGPKKALVTLKETTRVDA